jgi:hypothetical protein
MKIDLPSLCTEVGNTKGPQSITDSWMNGVTCKLFQEIMEVIQPGFHAKHVTYSLKAKKIESVLCCRQIDLSVVVSCGHGESSVTIQKIP